MDNGQWIMNAECKIISSAPSIFLVGADDHIGPPLRPPPHLSSRASETSRGISRNIRSFSNRESPVAVPGVLVAASSFLAHRPLPLDQVASSATGGAPIAPPPLTSFGRDDRCGKASPCRGGFGGLNQICQHGDQLVSHGFGGATGVVAGAAHRLIGAVIVSLPGGQVDAVAGDHNRVFKG